MNRYLLREKVKKTLRELVRRQDVKGFAEAIESPERFLNDPNATEEDYKVVRETAQECARNWGIYDKLFRVKEFGNWSENDAPFELESEKIYSPEIYAELTSDGLTGYMLGWTELAPWYLKEWAGLNREEAEKLEIIYKGLQEGNLSLEDYLGELKASLWKDVLEPVYKAFQGKEAPPLEVKRYIRKLNPNLKVDFDFNTVKLIWENGKYHAVYPVLYDLENGSPPLPLPQFLDGRNALKYVRENAVAPEELLKEVVRWADELHYADLNDEQEEVWKRIEKEASLEAKELLKGIYRNYVEPENLSWAEVIEIYDGGFFSYLYEGYSSTNINGSGYIAPERIGYWYLRPNGTIDYFEVSSEIVGTESEWTPESLIEAYEKITEAVENAHPLSGMALYESAVENWIKEELRPYLEEKVEETARSLEAFPQSEEEVSKLVGRIKEELQKEGISPNLLEDLIGNEGIAEIINDVREELEDDFSL